MTKHRQSHSQFAIRYAAIKADLLATEGHKIHVRKALSELRSTPDHRAIKRAEAALFHQQGAL